MNLDQIDKTKYGIYKLGEEPDDLEYWLTRTMEERLAAVTILRRPYVAGASFQRVFKIVKREPCPISASRRARIGRLYGA